MITIKNDFLTANILLKGAEVDSVLSNSTGHNYMWDKDLSIWNNTSPVLFPTVGKSNNDKIRYERKEYTFTNHGLARHHVFTPDFLSPSEVALTFNSSQLDEGVFPFDFAFTIFYKLIGKSLITTYVVQNPSKDRTTYFSVGAHPAFRCPFDTEHTFKDYYIEFENDNILTKHEITSAATYTGNTESFGLDGTILDFSKFDIASTPVFSEFKSKYVDLCEKGSTRKIRCSVEGFPYLAFWKKTEANFVCIEPWCGKSDDVDFNGEFPEKKDLIKLKEGGTWSVSYTTTFSYDKNLLETHPHFTMEGELNVSHGQTGISVSGGGVAINRGTITVSGNGGVGMVASGGGSVTNTGTITVGGVNNVGMKAIGSTSSATNDGKISGCGEKGNIDMLSVEGGIIKNNN